ncbi:hypothetical protein [Synechocystis sp. PCC 6714]|uniref:hypothetical protein n=1 Tax=Synechocystis sp. (strain PCC 6714) TaxID=1147 RepID=UPI00048F3847|nr:hypothetical protein [Synechocystis sp. PCC 6714]
MEFIEVKGDVDPTRALIYLWEIINLNEQNEQVLYRYVGEASQGADRPRTHYSRNVNKILQKRPYRKSKPDDFREIHRKMAEAIKNNHAIKLSFLCNVQDNEDINDLERKWQQHYGLL